MDLERIVGGLRPSEKNAIAALESKGWRVMYDCKIEDGRNPDGTRQRTFSWRGRYDLVLMLKQSDGRNLPEEIEEPKEPELPAEVQEGEEKEQKHFRPLPWSDTKTSKKHKRK